MSRCDTSIYLFAQWVDCPYGQCDTYDDQRGYIPAETGVKQAQG